MEKQAKAVHINKKIGLIYQLIKDNPTGVTMQFLMKKTNLSRTTVNSRIKALRSLDLVCTRTIPNHAISYTVNYSNDVVIQDR